MEKRFSNCLNETYDYFKSQGINILGKGYEEIMSSPTLFDGYVASLVEGASADSAAQMSQLMANTNNHLLTEGSVAGISPISSLSGPIIRKLWPMFALKQAVKTEVATTPSFLISYTRPYYETEDGVRHYVPRTGLLTGSIDNGYGVNSDLVKDYLTRRAVLTNGVVTVDFDDVYDETGATKDSTKHNLVVSSASKLKRQPLDADFTLVGINFATVATSGTAGQEGYVKGYAAYSIKFNKKIGVENVIVCDYEDAENAGTILVRANLTAGTAQVSVIKTKGAYPASVDLIAHRSVEYNEVTTSWSFDIGREDIRIGTGIHMNAPLAVESLTDMKALYQIDGTKEAVDLMTNAMALDTDGRLFKFIKDNFVNQPGNALGGSYSEYPGAANYLAVFDVKPAVGFAGGPKAWREELKPVFDHLAARIKNQTFLGAGIFNIVANPLDVQLITNIDWSFRGGQQSVDGVSVNYSVGTYYGSAYAYKIVSSEIVPQGVMFLVFIPENKDQLTYNYWAYSFSSELGYRDPNRAMVPSIMLCKRDTMKSFMPALAAVKIMGNDATSAFDIFRDYIPNKAGEVTVEAGIGNQNAQSQGI